MEEYNSEKYMALENVEDLFKRINRFRNEYNYCFDTFKPQSALPIILGSGCFSLKYSTILNFNLFT